MARQHLYLMARRLPDMRRSLVDLRLMVDEQAEALVRRTRRLLTAPAAGPQPGELPPLSLSPRRALTGARQRLAQAAQRLGQSWRRRQEPRRHLEYCQSRLEQLNPLAILQRGYAVATLLPQGR